MMNESIENFLTTCHLLNKKTVLVSSFESHEYEINRIANIVFVGVLIIPTMLLNTVAVITIWKTGQLKKKPCYFVILAQSLVDLGVGCVALPLFFLHLLVPFTSIDICTAVYVLKSITVLPAGLSVVTLSALTIERYIGVVHPYSYKTLVTKRRIVKFVLCGVLTILSIIVSSIFSQNLFMKCAAAFLFAAFLIFISFVYMRIYLVARRVLRLDVRPHEEGEEENKKRQCVRRKIKHAMTCFIVVISFYVLLVPFTLFPIFSQFGRMNLNVYVWWSVALFNLTPSVNSGIFFWRSKVLRQQAIKIIKNPKAEAPRIASMVQ